MGKGCKIIMKNWQKRLIILAGICAAIWMIGRLGVKIGSFRGNSFEKYRNLTNHTLLTELPEKATDFKFQCANLVLGAYNSAAFTLSDNEYEKYIQTLNLRGKDEYDEYNFTGKKVKDTEGCYDRYGTYRGLPVKKFKYVTEDDIREYTILYYESYQGAGSKTYAIMGNSKTGRIVYWFSGSN